MSNRKRIKMEKSFVHDRYRFYYSPIAIEADVEVIGFYFDGLGIPQTIHQKSRYGIHCIMHNNRSNCAKKK